MRTRIVLAYNGGAGLEAAITKLSCAHDADIVTLTLELAPGMTADEARSRALTAGALRAHVLDAREEFARDGVLPAVRSGAWERGAAAAAARPLVARKLVEVARIEQAGAVACPMRSPDAEQLAALIRTLDPTITVLAVAECQPSPGLPHSSPLKRPVQSPDAAEVELAFAAGAPVMVNGIVMRLTELLESLTTIAHEHGVGDKGEPYGGAAVVLHAAYNALQGGEGVIRLRLHDSVCDIVDGGAAMARGGAGEGAAIAQV